MTSRGTPSRFLRSVLHNGLGRYLCQLKRLSLVFSHRGPGSRAVREYIEEEVVDFAKQNPSIVVYVTPLKDGTPKVVAEYCEYRRQQQTPPQKPTLDPSNLSHYRPIFPFQSPGKHCCRSTSVTPFPGPLFHLGKWLLLPPLASHLWGIPGLHLGPLLFLIYMLPLGNVICRHGVIFHMYADDWAHDRHQGLDKLPAAEWRQDGSHTPCLPSMSSLLWI
uniref:Large ribosomal subunit protein mL43 n=1 Tax=Callorhinchus milii TaxID=7868 RepID=A0A4W3IVP1_CALMI